MYFMEDEEIVKSLEEIENFLEVDSPIDANDKENIKLTDAILEYHDPTPNIQDLFISFNDKFFWGKLGMVEVKWSNRMTSCAGVCQYEGKRGLCSIKLSAPLLSLRPRKDLVETLLHEMIHAYLFVTENYRDRDDHGVEFHKHMHRINQQAGTKITVYHSFHDEVAYFQKHIWRCNGPCRFRQPYYGFVKRSMNRKPGPYDFWWKEHQQNCGGTFTKISEPVKSSRKYFRVEKDKDMKSKPKGFMDIRKFFPSSSPPKTILSPSDFKENSVKLSNIYTLKDIRSSGNSSSTIKKPAYHPYVIPKGKEDKEIISNLKVQEKKVNDIDETQIKATIRNSWANKYPPTNQIMGNVSITSQIIPEMSMEMKKEVSCPVCNLLFTERDINEHVEECLFKGATASAQIQSTSLLEDHVLVDEFLNSKIELSPLLRKTQELDWKMDVPQDPICNKPIDQGTSDKHLLVCKNYSFENEELHKRDDVVSDKVTCPCCKKLVSESTINNHIDECLTFIALKGSLRNG